MKQKLFRLILNFLLSATIVLIFRNINWVQFTNPPTFIDHTFSNDIIIAGIIGFVLFIIGEIAHMLFNVFIVLTCGLGCLLYPIFALLVGYIKLFGTQYMLTDWYTFDSDILKITIISLAIGLIRIPSIKGKKKIVIEDYDDEV